MIVIGAGGFAKELVDPLVSEKYRYNEDNLFFFDNVSKNIPKKMFNRFMILRSFDEAAEVLNNVSPEFSIGVGIPQIRYKLSKKFEELGGQPTTIIAANAHIGTFGTFLGKGCTVMNGALVSSDASVGKGTLINLNCVVGHDVSIGEFSEIMPGVNITGHCQIGNYTSLGTGVVVVPKVKVGNNVSVAAGSVVTKDIPDNSLVVGVLPSRVVEKLPEFEL